MIDSYSFGNIVIDGVSHASDVIIYPDRVESGWRRKEGHSLCEEDLKDVLAFKPEALVVGTGKLGAMKVNQEIRRLISLKGIELFVLKTKEACGKFTELSKSKKTVGAFHLTC